MKSKRQIIIVTHNPNIPVLGDAEGIIVLERNDQGKVTFRKIKKLDVLRKSSLEREFVKLWKVEKMLSVKESESINIGDQSLEQI